MRLVSAGRSILVSALLAVMLDAGLSSAEKENPANPPDAGDTRVPKPATPGKAPAQDGAAAKSTRPTVYVPPPRGSVGARTGGGTRGHADAPRIAVLAPDHVGLTTRAQPNLTWYLSAQTSTPIELTLIADGAVAPLAVKQLASPQRSGIHVVDLSQLGVQLEEGTTYDWYVALVLDPKARDADVVAGGAIARRSATPELVAELKTGEPGYRVLARHGIWYDAIADLSTAIAAAPSESPTGRALRAERAGLLEQVGVGAVAQYDREGSAP